MKVSIRFDILTIFPEAFSSFAATSILKRAVESGAVEIVLHDIRQYAEGRHRSVDDAPYGGGAGMVMKPGPIISAVEGVERVNGKTLTILLTPRGKTFDCALAKELSTYDQIIMVAGHYEGVDQRVSDAVIDMEISIGDYVLTGGELAAMVVSDAVARMIEGVLGNATSSRFESFENLRLEYPQYTRPANYRGMKVPEELLSGNHGKINEWRERESYLITKKMRPDLL